LSASGSSSADASKERPCSKSIPDDNAR
jgi:hypothetical protein